MGWGAVSQELVGGPSQWEGWSLCLEFGGLAFHLLWPLSKVMEASSFAYHLHVISMPP